MNTRKIGILLGKPIGAVKDPFRNKYHYYYDGKEIYLWGELGIIEDYFDGRNVNFSEVENTAKKDGLTLREIYHFPPFEATIIEHVIGEALSHQVPLNKAEELYIKRVIEYRKRRKEEEKKKEELVKSLQPKISKLRKKLEEIVKKEFKGFSKAEKDEEIVFSCCGKELLPLMEPYTTVSWPKIFKGYIKKEPVFTRIELTKRTKNEIKTIDVIYYKNMAITFKSEKRLLAMDKFARFLIAYQRTDFEKAVEDFNRDKYWNSDNYKIKDLEITKIK
ncbi:MAG: hypothetical protein IB618_01940 [Candidatus Pacearchaeota archaeon]|nr:MAG: hypothetical protein IB618_01940 [Candidatus Pacearchaeota archaeon]